MKHKLFIVIAITILIITCCLSIFGCKPTMLTVQFKTLGADAIADVTIKKGDTLTLPTDPTIQYRDFLGWYTDEKLTVAFDTQQKITSNITLYAKWKIAEHEHIYGGEYIENNCKKKKCIICGFVHEEKLPVGLQFVLQSDGNYTLDTAGILDNKNVVIPSSVDGRAVTKIARYAFKNSSSGIVSVTIPSSIKEIGDQAFMNCKTLTSVTLQNGASAPLVGDNVFKDCSALTSFNFGENSKLKTLPKNMFANCSALASITLPSSTTVIGEGVFDGCSKLASIDLTKITAIGASAFKGCSAFTSISIPNAVTTISFGLFSECSSLTSVSIPSTVTIINAQAFNGCAKLQTI
ncbi:MAG: leucine-rich repeat protein, partial [Clostridia bacterium]